MDNPPELECMNVDLIKEELMAISENSTKEELINKIDFLVKQLNQSYEASRRNNLLLLEALEKAQTAYKQYEGVKISFKYRLKLFIKKVLIGWGWYEASYDELKELHFGKTRDGIPTK